MKHRGGGSPKNDTPHPCVSPPKRRASACPEALEHLALALAQLLELSPKARRSNPFGPWVLRNRHGQGFSVGKNYENQPKDDLPQFACPLPQWERQNRFDKHCSPGLR